MAHALALATALNVDFTVAVIVNVDVDVTVAAVVTAALNAHKSAFKIVLPQMSTKQKLSWRMSNF